MGDWNPRASRPSQRTLRLLLADWRRARLRGGPDPFRARIDRLTAACYPGSPVDIPEHVRYVVARLEEMKLK
jgi:hypothetical protein